MHPMQNYPDGPDKVAGFVDYHLIYQLQWDHIYTANYFLALLALLGASLAACTSTRQWPMVRVARRCCVLTSVMCSILMLLHLPCTWMPPSAVGSSMYCNFACL